MDTQSERPPALDAAKAELEKISTDTSHPMHAGYHRGDKAVMDHLDACYRKAVPASLPPAPDPLQEPGGHDTSTMTAEDRVAHTEVERTLRQTLGEDYESEMRDMRLGAGHLFSSPEGTQALTVLSDLITELGPLEEVRGIRYLAELGRSIKNHKGERRP